MSRAAAFWHRLSQQTQALREQLEPGDADTVAQILCCGLLAARCGPHWTGRPDSLRTIAPRSSESLAALFAQAAGDQRLQPLATELSSPAAAAALDDQRARGEDPLVAFYEQFLAGYDPQRRQRRGVYYTPRAVVDWLVRSAQELLAEQWGAAAAQAVWVDPACGSGAFLRGALDAVADPPARLPRLHGLELMPAALAVAHLQLDRRLAEVPLRPGDLRLHRADTLAGAVAADLVALLPADSPLVVFGNPPYAGHSLNAGGPGTFIGELLRDYRQVGGQPLGERNPKWLQDDYVKFIRWAQWLVERHGHGLVAFVTNHGYLENPTFRGMRRSLLDSFDELYVLDLHGNSKRRERTPDGGLDQNLFRIQQGVALSLMVRKP